MKFSSLFRKLITLTAGAFAITSMYAASGSQHRGSFTVGDPVQVNGKQLPAGDYDVKWEGEGPTVNISISKNGKEMATATASVVTLDQKASQDAAETKESSGKRELTSLRFSGKKYQLDVAAGGGQTASGDSVK